MAKTYYSNPLSEMQAVAVHMALGGKPCKFCTLQDVSEEVRKKIDAAVTRFASEGFPIKWNEHEESTTHDSEPSVDQAQPKEDELDSTPPW